MNVGIATVVEFLQKKGYTVEANPNTKISEEQYAILVKEFSTDKNLRLESERFIQERQNKERNKASVSIEGFEKQPEKQKSEDVIKTVVPEDARPKFKPVGKIDLDKLNGRKPEKVEKEPEQKQEVPVVERPVVKPEVKKEPEKREPEVKKEEVVIPPVSVVEPTPVVVEPVVVPEPVVETKPVEVEKVVEEVKKEEPKVVETAPVKAEEHKEEKKVETAQAEVTPVAEKAPEDDGVFKIRQPELGAKINVIGQIDLAALNQSTRPKKKSKEEKRREREEKEKIRQDQKKLMKEAIIKEIRKDDSKVVKNGPKESADAAKKKRNRINKEKVDVNNVATSNFAAPRPNIQGKGGNGNNNGQGGQGNNNRRNNNNNKDRFKKPVIKQEVSEEDVAKQVKEYALLRMQMMPYWYTEFARYHFDGIPPFRAINLEPGFNPEQIITSELKTSNLEDNPYLEAIAKEIKDQYMAGEYLLVAPMFAGQTERTVMLPKGNWYDFYTGKYVGNGERITVSPGLDRIPVFVKDGAIIPFMEAALHAPKAGQKINLEIRHYGKADGAYRLYDDDGETFDYEKGVYSWRDIKVTRDKKGRLHGTISKAEKGKPNSIATVTWKFMTQE